MATQRIQSIKELTVGDKVSFTCNGRGRGGHYNVTAFVTKVNRKTFKATEAERSYSPGTLWNIHEDTIVYKVVDL